MFACHLECLLLSQWHNTACILGSQPRSFLKQVCVASTLDGEFAEEFELLPRSWSRSPLFHNLLAELGCSPEQLRNFFNCDLMLATEIICLLCQFSKRTSCSLHATSPWRICSLFWVERSSLYTTFLLSTSAINCWSIVAAWPDCNLVIGEGVAVACWGNQSYNKIQCTR